MTSFLVIFIFIFMLYRSPRFDPPPPFSLMKRSLADPPAASGEGRRFETCFDPYIIFLTWAGSILLRCLLDSIQRSQAVAWCVFRFRHGNYGMGEYMIAAS